MRPEPGLPAVLESLRPHLAATEHILQQIAAEAGQPLGARLRDALDGGKRLRPALVLLVGQVFMPSSPTFYTLAAAVETLHTATLIHDDLVDGADTRRGRRTMHTTWSVGATVLAGDYLLARAAGLVAQLGQPRLLAILTDALREMCAGEIQQMFPPQDEPPTREAYYRAIEAKTASLLAASTEMAARLAGAAEEDALALRRYGRELGLAFQITDDILDFVGDEHTMGKPAAGDLRQGVATLPTLLYLERTAEAGPVHGVLAGHTSPERVREAMRDVRCSGAIEWARAEARTHAAEGAQALQGFPEIEATKMLRSLAVLVVERSG